MSYDRSGIRTGELKHVPISALLLDPHNPRLPASRQRGDQADLAVDLELGFDAFAVAQSIADNGFFAAEPLIAIPAEEQGKYVVVEGNRRLTALLGLAYPEIRDQFAEPSRWSKVADAAALTPDVVVPIVVHADRESTHVEVSRAHVVGKLQWRPYMQARFIAARVAEGRSIKEVAELIGITKSKAADLYRDQAIVGQAASVGLNTGNVEGAFSLLTVAMGNTKLRNHIGAPLGSRLVPGEDPVPAGKLEELKEVISWVFGDEDAEPVITDSRQMSALGNVVASDVGVGALRAGKSLDEAKQQVQNAGMDPRERLLKRITAATNALGAASDDLAEYASDSQVIGLLSDLEALVESMRNVVDQAADEVE
ncbi:ParB N-terminal domain-containing protein [Sanguibacter hominis ATCC BAA-789]|uniref:ParB N-terminal domain-containing protein n=1 Tax=Sanguibacter hominis ATCC BAA-789 TaxID=1312740 RepID=A0A9X5FAC2_9MICO|nr:ParB N-terminal domain-containing protein [Sanguibacter hominis]NKX92685.1 ParB N-terminal domain-containing protein [Sanguibacter hominis ATCC BAA-789]